MKNKIDKIDNSKIDANYLHLVEKKIDFFKDVLQKTITHAHKNKTLDILRISDVSICVDKLKEINAKLTSISEEYFTSNPETIINNLQIINNELSSVFSHYGTHSFEDLLNVCFGSSYKIPTQDDELLKFELLKK